MDDKIKELVNKVLDRYCSTEKGIALGFEYVDRNKLITMVIGKKQYYDPNKGSFDGFFSTLTKNFLIYLHKLEEVRIKKTIERNRKLETLGL